MKTRVIVSGVGAEVASAQHTEVATIVRTYTKATGAGQIEVYCEYGSVRVRTDGSACTATTGEPLSEGECAAWMVSSISVYYVEESVITVVSR